MPAISALLINRGRQIDIVKES